jgi:hypothetical protein
MSGRYVGAAREPPLPARSQIPIEVENKLVIIGANGALKLHREIFICLYIK